MAKALPGTTLVGQRRVGSRKSARSGVSKFADPANHKARLMDVEHINAIGNALADLTGRTAALRGYL